MAATPNWIGTNKGGEWCCRLTTQVTTRTGTPTESSLLINVTSANGAYIESLYAKALGTNIASVILLFEYKPSTQSYFHISSAVLGATTLPAVGADFAANGLVDLTSLLPITLFPASNTTTPNRGLRLGSGSKLYVALDQAVAGGWDVWANGGDC
jgi:hypothetical protein